MLTFECTDIREIANFENRREDGGGWNGLPARLAQARDVAAHGGFAQLVAGQAELAVHAARTAGQDAAVALAGFGGIARQLLQLDRGVHLLLVARRLAADD